MSILNIQRYFSDNPNIVGLITNEANIGVLEAAGYITGQEANIEALNSGPFQWLQSDLVLATYGAGLLAFFTPVFAADGITVTTLAAFSAAPIGTTLTSAHLFVGNGGNVATDVAVSGDLTLANTGAFTIAANAITTGKILNSAVTYAKMQNVAASSLLGNPTGGSTVASEITLGNGLVFSGTTLAVNVANGNYLRVAMTAAQWNGMYAAPFQIVAAPGANKMIIVDRVAYEMTFVAAQYAAGGAVALQYGNTVHGAGSLATATEAATDFTAAAASTMFKAGGSLSTGVALTAGVNAALYLSNQTAAFTTGDGTWFIHVWYNIVATT